MRILALVATYNEERFIGHCLDHLNGQGIEVYLIDNGSTDATVAIAERRRGRGLADIEVLPRAGVFDLKQILARKQVLAHALDADWFMHVDADEVRLSPDPGRTLGEAIQAADAAGYNAIDFQEYTFIPTREAPDHDHEHYQQTMRWYYPFRPFAPHRLNAWKRQAGGVDLLSGAGHLVRFEGLRMFPQPFPMRHYMCLSLAHAIRKYASRRHLPADLARGWHGWREQLDPGRVVLPSERDLRRYVDDGALDPSNALTAHPLIADPG